MGPNGLCSKLIYHDDIVYDDQINSKFVLVQKGVLVITYDCIGDNEHGPWIGLID